MTSKLKVIAPDDAERTYFHNGRTLNWGEDLNEETVTAMLLGEVFTLLHADGTPHCYLSKDENGTLIHMHPTPKGH